MATTNTLSSYPSLYQLTSRWATLKELTDSIKDVFLIGQGDPQLFRDLQNYQEEFDFLDRLLGAIFFGGRIKVYGKTYLEAA